MRPLLIRLGSFLERADNTARLLDVRYGVAHSSNLCVARAGNA
jgi:uncharacterized alpha-E superfamily protein